MYVARTWAVFPHVVGIYNTLCRISRVTGTLLQLVHLLELWPRVELSIFLMQAWTICLSSAESSVLGSFKLCGDCANIEFMAKLCCSVSSLFSAVSRESVALYSFKFA